MTALFHPTTVISVRQAAIYANVSGETIRRWCKEHGIGVQPGGKGQWRVSFPALSALLANDLIALAAIKAGHLDHPAVRPHLARRFEAGARAA